MGADQKKEKGGDVEPPDSKRPTVVMKAFVPPEDATLSDEPTDMEASDTDGGAEDWAGWDPGDAEEFWYRVYQIEDAAGQGGDAFEIALAGYGLRDRAHFDRLRETFVRHVTDESAFQAAADAARARASQKG